MGSYLMKKIFQLTPNRISTAHTEWLSGVWLSIQYHLWSTLWGLVAVRLSWLSARALVAQARGLLGWTPGDCQPFSLPLFSSRNFLILLCKKCKQAYTIWDCTSSGWPSRQNVGRALYSCSIDWLGIVKMWGISFQVAVHHIRISTNLLCLRCFPYFLI